MNILSLSSDKTFFDKNSDTFNRIKEYSKLVNQVVVVVFNQKKEYFWGEGGLYASFFVIDKRFRRSSLAKEYFSLVLKKR